MKKTKNLWFKAMNINDWLDEKNFPSDIKENQLRNIISRFMTYCIEFDKVVDDRETFIEMYQWCEDNFYDRYCFWIDQIDCRTEEDAIAFKLRWL